MAIANVYKLAFQITPIWLTGAPVVGQPNGMLPLAALTDPDLYQSATNQAEAATIFSSQTTVDRNNVRSYRLNESPAWDLDQAFGAFQVIPGGTLINQDIAQYPFANQHVASNATIFNPLNVSLVWDTPMKETDAWNKKFMILTNVAARLTDHNNGGGTYTVLTPAHIYENMLLKNLSDASRGSHPIPQNAWRFDFEKPLIRITDLQNAQNILMQKLTKGLETNGQWTGTGVSAHLSGTLPQFLPAALQAMPSARGSLSGSGAPN